jgi:hypothetical protein
VTDLDHEFLEDQAARQEEGAEAYAPGDRRIFTEPKDQTVSSLHELFRSGDLMLQPVFQRREVWDNRQASRLIESVVLEVPLPTFYFAENRDGTEVVIDGQQRLNALFNYLDNIYPLNYLTALPHLNGKRYKDLDKLTQKHIRGYALRTITFRKESDENLRFEIFERLNTGAIPLNTQELRNCIYAGSYNDLLIQLSEDRDFMALMGLNGPDKRMRDVEYVLRFAAFYHATYLKYKAPVARFLNEDMVKYRSIAPTDAEALRTAFHRTVRLIRLMLGRNAFRRYYRGDARIPEGNWEAKRFNASLFDVLMYSFARADEAKVLTHIDRLREAFITLMAEDDGFIDAIELSTSSTKMVQMRFEKWQNAVELILAQTEPAPRAFTRAIKEELLRANPTCAICGTRIGELDDAALDQIKQYWIGDKNIPENARLTHRYCNWARARND